MKYQNWLKLFSALMLAMSLASCSSTKEHPDILGDGTKIDENEDVIAMPESDMSNGIPEPSRVDTAGGVEEGRFEAIHFGYDSATVDEKGATVLKEIAKWAKENSEKEILVSGHCDERGTFEYNRALGQRRASATRAYLIKLGVSAKRVGTVSYGEEKPADPGHNDGAWAKNRRAEFGVVR